MFHQVTTCVTSQNDLISDGKAGSRVVPSKALPLLVLALCAIDFAYKHQLR